MLNSKKFSRFQIFRNRNIDKNNYILFTFSSRVGKSYELFVLHLSSFGISRLNAAVGLGCGEIGSRGPARHHACGAHKMRWLLCLLRCRCCSSSGACHIFVCQWFAHYTCSGDASSRRDRLAHRVASDRSIRERVHVRLAFGRRVDFEVVEVGVVVVGDLRIERYAVLVECTI